MPRELFPIITCEHAGNEVPARYRDLLRGSEALLQTHRGWDPGALSVASASIRARVVASSSRIAGATCSGVMLAKGGRPPPINRGFLSSGVMASSGR